MALVTTIRIAPVGINLSDGFSTVIAFNADPNVSFWEKTVTPIGLDGGDAIETTTMHNLAVRTMAARSLQTTTDAAVTAAYDPVVYDQIQALINVEDSITINFSNGDTLDFFGFLKSFIPGEAVEGEQPEAAIVIISTNTDPVTGAETIPNYKTSTGTD